MWTKQDDSGSAIRLLALFLTELNWKIKERLILYGAELDNKGEALFLTELNWKIKERLYFLRS